MKKFIEQRYSGVPMPLIHPVLVEGVRAGVADLAKGDEVVERVVPQLSGKTHAPAVDMVDVQRVGGSTLSALAAIPFKGRSPVPAEMVVIDGSAPVLRDAPALSVRGSDPGYGASFLARRATMLWASAIGKCLSTVAAILSRATRRRTLGSSQLHLVRQVRAGAVGRAAHRADDLAGCRRLIRCVANTALAFVVAVASHADRLHRARLAPLHVGGKTLNKNAAVWTGQNTVFAHGLTVAVGVLHG